LRLQALPSDRSHSNRTREAPKHPTPTRNILLHRSNIGETLLRRCFEARFRDLAPQPRRRNAFSRNRVVGTPAQVAFAL